MKLLFKKYWIVKYDTSTLIATQTEGPFDTFEEVLDEEQSKLREYMWHVAEEQIELTV